MLSYVHDMEKQYQAADMVICRAGASTCAEVCAFGKPALLIPYPYAVRDHQMLNARALEKAGAADVIAQDELTVEWLASYADASNRRSIAAGGTSAGCPCVCKYTCRRGSRHFN